MGKLNITSLDKLQITKVKPWCINFKYDNTKYFLRSDSDEDCVMQLYRREPAGKDKYTNTLMSSVISCISLNSLIKSVGNKNTLVYSQIDKEYFVKKLTELGLVEGIYDDKYQRYIKSREDIENQITELRKKQYELTKYWNKTEGRGSKTSSLEHQFKVKACERKQGAKDDEWCEEYKDNYGNTHPEYGGILTDLYNLTYGTVIYVTNGDYSAMIAYDKHGDKALYIVATDQLVTLTENHHSAYIYTKEEN